MNKRPNSNFLDQILGDRHTVLDHGFVRIVDYMGNDDAIVQAARTSYGAGTKTPSDDRSLIRYLMRKRHTTPLEMCEIKMHVKVPMFVGEQWLRHRTASLNKISGRYSILPGEFYVPESEDIQPQSKENKQGRNGTFSDFLQNNMRSTIEMHGGNAYDLYKELLTGWPWMDEEGKVHEPGMVTPKPHDEEHGMAREMARMVLPANIYTEFYWKIDLHNLLHFLSLRADPHAQMEIRVYAELICEIISKWVPHAFEAFEDYVMDAEQFSKQEMDVVRALIERAQTGTAPNFLENLAGISDLSKREQKEFLAKIEMVNA
jgi:thymidylate synthase (FAD)